MTPRMRRLSVFGLAGVALLGVFLLYARPEFLVMLAEQLWSCF